MGAIAAGQTDIAGKPAPTTAILVNAAGSIRITGVRPSQIGAGTRIRTRDLLITNQLLYQLSYTGTVRWDTVCILNQE